jgi:hypothetical protein
VHLSRFHLDNPFPLGHVHALLVLTDFLPVWKIYPQLFGFYLLHTVIANQKLQLVAFNYWMWPGISKLSQI